MVEKLIKQKQSLASVTCGADDFTPLHLAAINGRTAVAGMLIKQVESGLYLEHCEHGI